MIGLRLAEDLELPLDYVTKTAAIMAQRRKGKTYTASVVAEELVDAGIPWVALDPTGAWWGLRAGADGDPAGGLPVVVLGGQHGDAPLEVTAGRYVAELVVEEPGWYVLDLSLLDTRTAERTFATDFAEALIRRKRQPGRDFPMHLFVDEADMFVPQERDGGGDTRMLGAYQAIVRRGGLHGLGSTLISQRPALVNKSVLTQLDLLVLLRLVAGQDQDAVNKNYVSRAGSREQGAELMGSLASLGLGEAWFWEPGAEPPLFQRSQVRARRTFNSSATPKPGEQRVEPKGLAEIDLDAVKDAMAASIERARADDPKELRKQIKGLERELAQRPEVEPEVVTVEVEVEVERHRLPEGALASLDAMQAQVDELGHAITDFRRKARTFDETAPVSTDRPGGATARSGSAPRPVSSARSAAPAAAREPRPARPSSAGDAATVGDVTLGLAARRIIQVLYASEDLAAGRSKVQVALLANYHPRAKGFTNALGQLRSAGLLEAGEPLRLTDAGDTVARTLPMETIPAGRDLLEFWKAQPKIGKAAGLILDTLADAWPSTVSREDLAAACDYHPRAKGFTNALGQLRGLGLVTTSGDPALTDDFGQAVDG